VVVADQVEVVVQEEVVVPVVLQLLLVRVVKRLVQVVQVDWKAVKRL